MRSGRARGGCVLAQHRPCCSLSAGSWSCHAPCMAVSQPWLCCIATQPAATPSASLSRYSQLYRDTPIPTISLSRYRNCIVTHFPQPVNPQPVMIQNCIVTHSPTASPCSCHDTIWCIATQFPSHQATTCHDTTKCIVTCT